MESHCHREAAHANKASTATYEDICEQLDNALLKLFELLDTLMEERIKLHDFMKFGFMDMAKARYSLGNHRVSSLQLNMKEMSPLKHVVADESVSMGYSFTSYAIVNTDTANEENAIKIEDGIRKRTSQIKSNENDDIKQLSSKTENMDLNNSFSEEKTVKNNLYKMHDPLKWFGILTPQSLRNCQKYFQQSIDNTASIASIQNEIKELFNYIEYLKTEKKKLLLQQKSN